MDWYQIKLLLAGATGLHMDALHVHVGVLAQLAAAAATRRSIASPWPWLILLLALLANEAFDLAYETWPNREEQIGESVKDVWNTMLLPTLLLLVVRFAPGLLIRKASPLAADGDFPPTAQASEG